MAKGVSKMRKSYSKDIETLRDQNARMIYSHLVLWWTVMAIKGLMTKGA